MTTLADARRRDDADDLGWLRDRFDVPGDGPYLDGNSLGAFPRPALAVVHRVLDEWRTLGVRAWTDADPPWFRYAEHLGDRLAPHVGAREGEVVVGNSTTVNVHTLVGTVLDAGGETVLVDELNFPTDTYAIRARLRSRGLDPADHLVVVESRDGRTIAESDVEAALDEHDVDLVWLPSVLYRSGQRLDVPRLTDAAHETGALAGWDLAHSIGAIPHDLHDAGVDLAAWCSYKYLDAGPGGLAGLYVHADHHDLDPALAGWWGNDPDTQFDLRPEFSPAPDAGRWQIGTPPILAAAPLEGTLDVLAETSVEALRARSLALTDHLTALVDDRLGDEFVVGTPREHDRRGAHVAVEHDDAARIAVALADRGVVVDFRPPNVVRACPAPLYCTHEDVWRFVDALVDLAETGGWREYEPATDVT